jgi:hypothetical protein
VVRLTTFAALPLAHARGGQEDSLRVRGKTT